MQKKSNKPRGRLLGLFPRRRSVAQQDYASEISNDVAARRLVVRFLPLGVLPLIGWGMWTVGHTWGWYEPRVALVLIVTISTILYGMLIWRSAILVVRTNRQAEAEIKRVKGEATAMDRVKSAFLANMSHEIRTPLTAIVGFADLYLGEHRTADERLEFVRTIRRNGEHLLTIVNDILDLSKIDAGKMRIENVACSPSEIIAEVASMLRATAIDKGLSLEVTYEGAIPKTVRTDPVRLRQILINLVGNAIKFTDGGGVTMSVGMATEAYVAAPLLKIAVNDTGVGIDPEKQKLLFQPFMQTDDDAIRRMGGTGLGLSISKHLAGLLGGDITLTSVIGQGSTFALTIGTGSLDSVPMLDNPSEAVMASKAVMSEYHFDGTVLLAEDGATNQKLIGLYLRETGLNVDMVSNGQKAFEKAIAAQVAGRPYDLILMDMQMPVLDGYAAAMKLRDKGYRYPIVALTANALASDREKCLSAGCNDFLTKPIDPEKFLKTISRYVRAGDAAGRRKAPKTEAA